VIPNLPHVISTNLERAQGRQALKGRFARKKNRVTREKKVSGEEPFKSASLSLKITKSEGGSCYKKKKEKCFKKRRKDTAEGGANFLHSLRRKRSVYVNQVWGEKTADEGKGKGKCTRRLRFEKGRGGSNWGKKREKRVVHKKKGCYQLFAGSGVSPSPKKGILPVERGVGQVCVKRKFGEGGGGTS